MAISGVGSYANAYEMFNDVRDKNCILSVEILPPTNNN